MEPLASSLRPTTLDEYKAAKECEQPHVNVSRIGHKSHFSGIVFINKEHASISKSNESVAGVHANVRQVPLAVLPGGGAA
jgi:hypothetical protein